MPQAALSDRKLVRELVLVVLIKLVLITALWWVFVREEKVPVAPDSVAARFAPPASAKQQISTDGEHDGQ
ncbi:MAG: hypothetical protein CVU19_11060 [Betaproteobacteria bacterium HGW-Betaproteobacteria-13]|jgi:hypothetical protein|uniref:Uncharacterized protein n=1 Tax=Parazoarcus communis TaxID=41977 RepID=A0A2U8H3X5_9RHOO|nr:cytochrome oxidase putative small subunit CydP [Parazoarcus communis]AWI80491.1 hypothetical protein CEW87_14640 [Parazoarcus communis]PKO80688.1 MAG: hypothetical protein CVU19_11060 [Betaproteobacteria bacterium HGW-Betaproteobacteria-13]